MPHSIFSSLWFIIIAVMAISFVMNLGLVYATVRVLRKDVREGAKVNWRPVLFVTVVAFLSVGFVLGLVPLVLNSLFGHTISGPPGLMGVLEFLKGMIYMLTYTVGSGVLVGLVSYFVIFRKIFPKTKRTLSTAVTFGAFSTLLLFVAVYGLVVLAELELRIGIDPGSLFGMMFLGAVNYAINRVMVGVIATHLKKHVIRGQTIGWKRILIATLIGLLIDVIVISLLTQTITLDAYFTLTMAIFVIVGVLVAAAGYFVMFRKAFPKKHALIAAAVFGTLSNPAWLMLLAPNLF